MKYLSKTYVYTTHDCYEIKYDNFINKIITACYYNFGFAPARSAIRLCSVEDELNFYHCYETHVTFEVHTKNSSHTFMKRYLLDYFHLDIEAL